MEDPKSDGSLGSISGLEDALSDDQFNPSTPKVSSKRPSLTATPVRTTPARTYKKTPVRTPRSASRLPATPYARHAMHEAKPRQRTERRDLRGDIVNPLIQLRALSRTMRQERLDEKRQKQLNEEKALTHLNEQVVSQTVTPQQPEHQTIITSRRNAELEPSLPELEAQEEIINEFDSFADVGPPEFSDLEDQRERGPRMSITGEEFNSDGNIAIPEGIIRQEGDFSMLEMDFEYDNRLSNAFSEGSRMSISRDFSKRMIPSSNLKRKSSKPAEFEIPLSSLRALAKQTLQKKHLSAEALRHLSEIGMEFFEQQVEDLQAYAQHAGHKAIDHNDALLLMKRAKLRDDDVSDPFCIATQFLSMDEITTLENFVYKDRITKVAKDKKKKSSIDYDSSVSGATMNDDNDDE
ncbi:unnamed protein product [Kuraishia capsulata CBS 1993]|uniref:CENP-T/Histone H4 histone fold domain-containing protein n=1 Tax=Kuraishia capsulata CBS 1993 TaxID=1382522 RepID=W6MM86_9ASCO|nr:uncharacterized protein KUCA_T00003291001 [Kuraishia capsulata CBS 1993]CDK27313.1 unnamed protein product [Kuraishia capsulata CBS 1993]